MFLHSRRHLETFDLEISVCDIPNQMFHHANTYRYRQTKPTRDHGLPNSSVTLPQAAPEALQARYRVYGERYQGQSSYATKRPNMVGENFSNLHYTCGIALYSQSTSGNKTVSYGTKKHVT